MQLQNSFAQTGRHGLMFPISIIFNHFAAILEVLFNIHFLPACICDSINNLSWDFTEEIELHMKLYLYGQDSISK